MLGNVTWNMKNAISGAVLAATSADRAAREAEAAEQEVRALRDAALNASRRIAFAAIPEVLANLKSEARAAAKTQALQQAALLTPA